MAVFEEPLLEGVVPAELGWTSVKGPGSGDAGAHANSLAPYARIAVESNSLAWRGLLRATRLKHRDLLVVGSTRRADYGQVGLGAVAGELLPHLECPLAVAPRGMRDAAGARLQRIGVGFEATPESEAALGVAGSIALAAGAELHVRGVVDDRVAGGTRTEDTVLGGDAIVARRLASLSDGLGLPPSRRARGRTWTPCSALRPRACASSVITWTCSSSGRGTLEHRAGCTWEAPAGHFCATRPRES